MRDIIVRSAGHFQQLYTLPPEVNVVVCIGGRGGKKTYEVSKFSAWVSTCKKKRVAVLRDEKETIRESILNEIFLRYDTANVNGALSEYQKNESGIRNVATGEMMVFTKGFRASTLTRTANLKSISDVDYAIIEEAEDIRDENKYNVFADSIRKEGSVIIIILNTPDINHWLIKRYFHLEIVTMKDVPELNFVTDKDLDGYWKVVPKDIEGFRCIQTSYTDNPHLPKNIISNYKGYGDPESHLFNLHYYLTAIKGFASSGRKGQILKKVKPISLEEYMALPYREIFGQDFGTAAPAGLVGVKIHKNSSWMREINYLPKDVLELGKMYCRLGFGMADMIVADSADKKSRDRLRDGWRPHELDEETFLKYPNLARGWWIVPCKKGPDSITGGLDLMSGMNLFCTTDSINGWNEIRNYIYAVDKNNNYTNDPEDDFNHLIDPWRYIVQEVKGPKAAGSTSGSS